MELVLVWSGGGAEGDGWEEAEGVSMWKPCGVGEEERG